MSDPFPKEANDLATDARQLLQELDQAVPGVAAISAECRPPVDVVETSGSVEVIVDIPGVPADSVRVAVRRDTLLVVGAKLAGPIDPASRFHVAERSYGRFARAVRVFGAFDASRAEASIAAGRLRVVLPRIEERRGRMVMIPVGRA
jgi:HSP20 family protein